MTTKCHIPWIGLTLIQDHICQYMSVHRINNTELYHMLNMMQIIIIIMDIYSDENLPSDINPSNQLPKSHIKLHQIRPLSMALNLLLSLPTCNFPIAAFPSIGPIHLKSLVTSRIDFVSGPVQCKVSSKISSSTNIVR